MKSSPGTAGAPPALRVGLTGGIATGKSVVAQVFRQEGAFVLDADTLGHEMMEPGGSAYAAIHRSFGDGILAADGRIDRKKLGDRVFSDDAQRLRLNAILHPLIVAEADRRVNEFLLGHAGGIAVTQAALLAEAGAADRFDRIVLTECDATIQLRRLMDRDRLSEEEAGRRIAAQAAPEARRRIAHVIIDTSGTLEETRRRAREAFRALKRERESS